MAKAYNTIQRYTGLYTDNSLSDLTKLTKVEPLVIISKECMGMDIMPDLMNGLLNYTIADYSQAAAILGMVTDVRVVRILDKLNPARDKTGLLIMAEATNESYYGAEIKNDSKRFQFSLPVETMESKVTTEKDSGKSPSNASTESTALAVGKLVDITINVTGPGGPTNGTKTIKNGKNSMEVPLTGNEANTVKMPINFRLIPRFISSPQMLRIIGHGTDDTGLITRFERAVDGGISPFIDFILAQDLIQERRKALISDQTQTMQDIVNRVNTSKRIGVMTNNASLATLSNIFIVTESERDSLESQFGNKLKSASVRERIFQNVAASVLVIVDRQWNTVTFWHRGYDNPSTVSFKELKLSGNKAPDLMDQLKSFNLGMPISMA